MASGVPKIILDKISASLAKDGFRKLKPGIFVKQEGTDWGAWIGISGNQFILCPNVGVTNARIIKISDEASIGTVFGHRDTKYGNPPLIISPLEKLLTVDDSERGFNAWKYHGEELDQDAANDIVYWIRERGYPFISSIRSLDTLLDAVNSGFGSQALQREMPAVLAAAGKFEAISNLRISIENKFKDRPYIEQYNKYIDNILQIFNQDNTQSD